MNDDKKPPTTIEFAPGCFDNFDGTQEELDALIQELQALVASGRIFEESTPLDEAEAEKILKSINRNTRS